MSHAYDQNELNQMIEGFMLTARGYGMQVRLENVVQENVTNMILQLLYQCQSAATRHISLNK